MSEEELGAEYEAYMADLEAGGAGAGATYEDIFGPPSWVEISAMIDEQEQSIVEKRQGLLETFANEVVGAAGGVVVDLARGLGTWLKQEVALPLVESDIVNPELRPQFRRMVEQAGEGAIVPALIIAVWAVLSRISAIFGIYHEAESQRVNAENPIQVPGIGELIAMVFRGQIDELEGIDGALRQGISTAWWDRLKHTATTLPDPDVLRTLYLRGESSEVEHDTYLEMQGWSEDAIKLAKRAYRWMPGPGDLITMAVREAFSEEYSKRFGTSEGLPPDFVAYAGKQGVDPKIAEYLWRAHWELPSIQMGYEMLHRGIIDREHLEQLFVALDIMPWWRSKLVEMSYRPLTRVDVRRMYGLGVLPTRNDVVVAYKELGYNQTNAERMADFTIRYETQKEKDLTKAEIIKGYKKKVLSRDDAEELLRQLGYSSAEAGYLLVLEDVAEQEELEDLVLERIEYQYVAGIIDATVALAEMGEISIPSERANLLLQQWQQKRAMQRTLPTKADWLRWLKAGRVDADQVKNELHNLGYDWAIADLYIAETIEATA